MRMMGKIHPSWCPYCHGTAGPDCPDSAKDKRVTRKIEKREWRKEWHEEILPKP